AALGTAIITSAFVVGDTFDASIRDIGRTQYGPVDEAVRVSNADDLDAVAGIVRKTPIAHTDGTLTLVDAPVAVRAGDQAEPTVLLAELDFDAGRAFGGAPG